MSSSAVATGNDWHPLSAAGDDKWTVRCAPPAQGDYTFHVRCSDPTNKGLNGSEQSLLVTAYRGDNPLLQHGFLRESTNKRHFEHADGTPVFQLGDTWWQCLCKRMTWASFQELTADRKAKGFHVVQIVCGPEDRGDRFFGLLERPAQAGAGGRNLP